MRIGLMAHDPLRIAGLQAILEAEPDCVLEVLDIPTLTHLKGLDLVILDGAGDTLVLTMLEALLRVWPPLQTLVLGAEDSLDWVERVIDAGARGYVAHRATEAEVRGAVRVVWAGSIWAPRRVLGRLLERARTQRRLDASARVRFSPRELDVLALLLEAKSNGEMAHLLGIGEGTIKAHLSRMMARTGTANRTALTMLALALRTEGPVPLREGNVPTI